VVAAKNSPKLKEFVKEFYCLDLENEFKQLPLDQQSFILREFRNVEGTYTPSRLKDAQTKTFPQYLRESFSIDFNSEFHLLTTEQQDWARSDWGGSSAH
jgi:hypothetical protein